MATTQNPRARRRWGRGLSLIEVLATTALVGMGVAGMMVAAASGSRVTGGALNVSQASYLLQEVREWTLKLPFSDTDPADQGNPPGPDGSNPQVFVDDLDDLYVSGTGSLSYSPPRDGTGAAINGMSDWKQTIQLTWRDVNELTRVVPASSSDVIHVEVTVLRNNQPVLTSGWFVTRR
ncbi:MAG TPA: hypothetical protein VFJ30_16600 [Phycisphaerae bacterium]|nr:hypothetical protein [Phycisphaerae bacterium]